MSSASRASAGWSASELAKLQQQDLFMTRENQLLEKIPYRGLYHYRCADAACPGHRQTIIDWEAGEFYRRVIRPKGLGDPAAVHDGMRRKVLGQLSGADRDTYFFTGNMAAHQAAFLILGVFWPLVDLQQRMF